MQAQAAKRTFGGRFLIIVVALAILFGAALAALIADIVDRSDATTPNMDRVIANPSNATDSKSIAPPQEYLPEEAVDAQLRREQPNAYWNPGMGEGWINGQHVRVMRPIDAERMRYLEQNLYLPDDSSSLPGMQDLQPWQWETETQGTPASPTGTYDYREWTSGQWTSGLTER